jgi:RNA polymerase sigma-70 factor (ECF subfamily)
MTQQPPDDQRELQGLAAAYDSDRLALLRFLRARTRDASEAEDVLQELWIRLRETPNGPIANPRAYLFQMANNLVLDRERERRRRQARDRTWTEQTHTLLAAADGAVQAVDARRTPEDALGEAQERAALRAAIQALPEAARRAFCLHKLEELSHAQVAARLGISRSGVEKHIALAMKHLRRALLDCGSAGAVPSTPTDGQENS